MHILAVQGPIRDVPSFGRQTKSLRPSRWRSAREWPSGLPVHRSTFRALVWLPAHVAADIKVRRFHDLRTTHIMWLLLREQDDERYLVMVNCSANAITPTVGPEVGHDATIVCSSVPSDGTDLTISLCELTLDPGQAVLLSVSR